MKTHRTKSILNKCSTEFEKRCGRTFELQKTRRLRKLKTFFKKLLKIPLPADVLQGGRWKEQLFSWSNPKKVRVKEYRVREKQKLRRASQSSYAGCGVVGGGVQWCSLWLLAEWWMSPPQDHCFGHKRVLKCEEQGEVSQHNECRSWDEHAEIKNTSLLLHSKNPISRMSEKTRVKHFWKFQYFLIFLDVCKKRWKSRKTSYSKMWEKLQSLTLCLKNKFFLLLAIELKPVWKINSKNQWANILLTAKEQGEETTKPIQNDYFWYVLKGGKIYPKTRPHWKNF